MKNSEVFAALCAVAIGTSASAALLGFEPDGMGNLPDGTAAADDLAITDQFAPEFGVRFGIDNDLDGFADAGTFAVLEDTHDDSPNGFLDDPTGTGDLERPGLEGALGDYFLRTPNNLESDALVNLIVTFDSDLVNRVVGEIWDIDGNSSQGTEQWRVIAYAADRSVLGTIDSPIGTTTSNSNPLQAGPWAWGFDFGDDATVAAVGFQFVGTKQTGIGLAFDNFAYFEVPGPGPLALLAAAGVVALRRGRA